MCPTESNKLRSAFKRNLTSPDKKVKIIIKQFKCG